MGDPAGAGFPDAEIPGAEIPDAPIAPTAPIALGGLPELSEPAGRVVLQMLARRGGGTAVTGRNDLGIDGDSLVVVPRGMDKLWGFRRRVVVPLARITDVAVERNPHRVPMGWRGPGLDAMGKLVGTFHPEKQRHDWNFSGRGNVLTVGIAGGEPFDRLYLSVDDAEAARVLISGALPAAEDSKPQPPAE